MIANGKEINDDTNNNNNNNNNNASKHSQGKVHD